MPSWAIVALAARFNCAGTEHHLPATLRRRGPAQCLGVLLMVSRLKLVTLAAAVVFALACAMPLCAQSTTTFQYFYDDLGRLAKVIDSSGNQITYSYDAVGNLVQITRGSAPGSGTLAITNFTPQQGGPGTAVTIQGQGFSATPSSDTVKFNGTAATVTSATTSTLVVTVPSGATTGPISVTVGSSTATSSTSFTVFQVPMITSVSPTQVNFNTTVPTFQVTGTNLTGATFSFAPVFSPPAVTVTSASINATGTAATLSLSVGAGPAGTFVLVATNANGSSSTIPSAANSLQVLNPNTDVTPPTVSIASPTPGTSLITGQTITVSANATDNVGVTRVDFSVNGTPFGSLAAPPYGFTFTVPAGVTNLTFAATARDAAGNVGTATPVTVAVVADPLTTLQGKVVDSNNNPLPGASAVLQVNGLNAQFFKFSTTLTSLPDLTGLTPDLTKLVSAVNMLNPNQLFGADPFGVNLGHNYAGRFASQIQVATPGDYTFTLGADEGARLVVGGSVVVDTPTGTGVFQQNVGTATLSSGLTPIEVDYYHSVGASELQLSYTGPGIPPQVVQPAVFSTEAQQFSATTDTQGNFSIPNVPTNLGNVSVVGNTTVNGTALSGVSSSVAPVGGGITSIGNIVAVPSHWVQLAPTGAAPPPSAVPTVFDPITNRMIVFGVGDHTNDVWVLTNANGLIGTPQWINLSPLPDPANGFPPGRSGNSSVYDPMSNRLIIMDGCLGNCLPVISDLWVLTNANGLGGVPAWIELSPSGGPPSPRVDQSAVYDPGTNSMIVFAGQDGCCANQVTFSDAWVLSNANGLGGTPTWTQLSPSGGPPPGQDGHTAVYDSLNNVMTVFGGLPNQSPTPTNAVWVLSNANGQGGTPVWTNLIPEGAAGSPPARARHTAVYNISSNRMTIFGGSDQAGVRLNDTWVLRNANGLGGAATWSQLGPSGGPPLGRIAHGAILDLATDRMTVFGGGGSTIGFNDTWVLTTADGVGAPSVGGGTVTGLVTLKGGTPAPNGLVQISPTDSGVPFSRSARTDSNGNYTVAGVPSGRTFTIRAFNPNGSSSKDSTGNSIAADGQTLTVNLTLPAAATVHVTALKVDGTPFAGAEISLQDSFRQFLRIVGFADSGGILNIADVPEGNFTVQARDPSTLSILGNFNGTVTSTDQGQTIDVTIQDPGTTVTGNVVDASGSAVAGAQVTTLGVSATTAADGTFSISGVPTVLGNITAHVTFRKTDGTLLVGESPPFPPVPAGTTNVGTIKVAPPVSAAYVANESDNTVSAYSIDTTAGALTAVPGSPFPAGTLPISVTVDPTGHFVYVANGFDNDVSAYSIDPASGALTAVPGSPFPAGSSPSSVTVDPTGHFVYVANFDGNDVLAYSIDPATGALTPVPGSPFPAGSSPNSVTVDPTGHFVYVANINGIDVSAYTVNSTTGALAAVPGSPFPAGLFPSSVTVDPTGHFVYVANNGDDVSAYTVNSTTGALAAVPGSPFPAGLGPSSVTVDPTGHFVYVANAGDNTVSAYSIDPATGALTTVPGSPFPAGSFPSSVTTTAGPR